MTPLTSGRQAVSMTAPINIDTADQGDPTCARLLFFLKGIIDQKSHIGKLYNTLFATFAKKIWFSLAQQKYCWSAVSLTPLPTKSAIAKSIISTNSNLYSKRQVIVTIL
jgi:hypothetical protein